VGAEHVEGGAHGPHHEVPVIVGQLAGTLPVHRHADPGRRDLGGQVVVEPQGETQRVEARAQVGAGGGDPDANRPGGEVRRHALMVGPVS
jgi:hypothetical protein